MAIDTIKSYQEYIADGRTAVFPFDFNYNNERPEDIIVGIRTGDNEFRVVEAQYYQLKANPAIDGGTIRFIRARRAGESGDAEFVDDYLPAGTIVRIARKSLQTSSATWQLGLDMTAMVALFDRLFKLTQENKGRFDNTIKTFATQHNIKLYELLQEHNNSLLFWDNEKKTLTPTDFPKKDVVRAKDGLFFRISSDEKSNIFLEWSENGVTDWHSIAEQAAEAGKVDDVQLNGTSVVVDRIANIEPVAGDIAYTNPRFPTIATLQDAMDELLYVNPAVSVSGGGNYEIGSTRATTKLTWTWNKTIQSQSLNQGIGDLAPTVREYTYETEISSDTTFTVTGSDGKRTVYGSTKVSFLPKRYWGVSASPTLTDSGIIGLNSELSANRIQTRTFDCSGGKYFYFAIKTSYCTNIKFKVGGLSFSDMDVETRQFTNASGHTDSYNIYRVHNLQTGAAILVEVL